MDYKKLIQKIEEIFVNEDKFIMKKIVEDFIDNNRFVGDFYNYFIFEDKPEFPIIYSIGGPYDKKSGAMPQQALAWENGKLVLNTDFTEFAMIRTSIMSYLLLKVLNEDNNLQDKKFLIFGSSKYAKQSVVLLKELYPVVKEIDYVNTRGGDAIFDSEMKSIGVNSNALKRENLNLGTYDFIFCHTHTNSALLDEKDISQIKKGAVITSFIASSDSGEVSDAFYNDKNANIIMDWDKNIDITPDVSRAVKSGSLRKENIILLKDLISGEKKIDKSKNYTLARFKGTPMQNLAVMKVLMGE